ncbi:MAG: hypothetical protein ACE5FL_14745, partial [Myxococcota bacterium]
MFTQMSCSSEIWYPERHNRASADQEYMRIGREVAPNTVEVEAEVERGTIQRFFDYDEIAGLLAGFAIDRIDREDRVEWSSTGRAYSRWEILARR